MLACRPPWSIINRGHLSRSLCDCVCLQTNVAIKVIKADAYKEYHDLIEREIMVRHVLDKEHTHADKLVTFLQPTLFLATLTLC